MLEKIQQKGKAETTANSKRPYMFQDQETICSYHFFFKGHSNRSSNCSAFNPSWTAMDLYVFRGIVVFGLLVLLFFFFLPLSQNHLLNSFPPLKSISSLFSQVLFTSRVWKFFLSHLATKGNVAASTQRQALNALVFLYRDGLDLPLDGKVAPVRSKRKPSPPTVLTQEEVQQVLRMISGTHGLMAKLLYGAGLRLVECIRLPIYDVNFAQNILYVRGDKGSKGCGNK